MNLKSVVLCGVIARVDGYGNLSLQYISNFSILITDNESTGQSRYYFDLGSILNWLITCVQYVDVSHDPLYMQ